MAEFVVLTGGPCAGKTTLIERLHELGYPILEESAAAVIRSDPDGKLRRKPLEFQKAVLRRQVLREEAMIRQASPAPFVFADRGVGDHFAYLRHQGLEPFPELLDAWESAATRYRAVFLLELGPDYHESWRRPETRREAMRLHELLREEYSRRHASVTTIPWMGVEERLERLLGEVARLL